MLEYQDDARYSWLGYRYYQREGTGDWDEADKYRLPKHWRNLDKFPLRPLKYTVFSKDARTKLTSFIL